jgi:hypothetical protein
LFNCGFGGADVHVFVEQAGIGRNDFAVKLLGQGYGEGGFANGRWADDDEEGGLWVHLSEIV